MKNNLRFEDIIKFLSQGMIATRAAWQRDADGNPSIFVFLQLSVVIEQEHLDKIGHVPPMLKEVIKKRTNPLVNNFHLCILFAENNYDYFSPSTFDLFSDDWIVLEPEDMNPNKEVQTELPLEQPAEPQW